MQADGYSAPDVHAASDGRLKLCANGLELAVDLLSFASTVARAERPARRLAVASSGTAAARRGTGTGGVRQC